MGTTRCSRSDFLKALRTVEQCEVGERGITRQSITTCAPSCRRPESSHDITDVIECVRNLNRCAENELQRVLPGEQCARCIEARPTCATACNDRQVCVRGRQDNPRCVNKKAATLILKVKQNLKERIQGLSKEQVVPVVLEF